jgi:hypothetical protein
MLNGFPSRLETFQVQNPTEVTNSEPALDSYECQVFSIKDLCPESSDNSNRSPIKKFRLINSYSGRRSVADGAYSKLSEISTNFANIKSRRITEEVKSSVGTSITEFRLATLNSPEVNKGIDIVLGVSPCMAYCGKCKSYVQTAIDYQDGLISKYLVKFSQAFSMCCGKPDWADKLILHKCSSCSSVLGKV